MEEEEEEEEENKDNVLIDVGNARRSERSISTMDPVQDPVQLK